MKASSLLVPRGMFFFSSWDNSKHLRPFHLIGTNTCVQSDLKMRWKNHKLNQSHTFQTRKNLTSERFNSVTKNQIKQLFELKGLDMIFWSASKAPQEFFFLSQELRHNGFTYSLFTNPPQLLCFSGCMWKASELLVIMITNVRWLVVIKLLQIIKLEAFTCNSEVGKC